MNYMVGDVVEILNGEPRFIGHRYYVAKCGEFYHDSTLPKPTVWLTTKSDRDYPISIVSVRLYHRPLINHIKSLLAWFGLT